MDLKLRLQRMLQIMNGVESVDALADIERDILLEELRTAYTELKYGAAENEQPYVAPAVPVADVAQEEEAEEDEEDEPEVEVELIFNESDEVVEEEPTEEELPEAPIVEPEPIVAEQPVAAEEEPVAVEEQPVTAEDESVAAEEEPVAAEELPIDPIVPTTPKRSPLLSLYEDNNAHVVGEQFHEVTAVGDMISCPKGVAESAPVVSLHQAIGIADKYMLIRELFADDAQAYASAIDAFEAQPTFEDCVIYIAEHYNWSPNSEATKLIMELLQRKYNA